MKKNIINATIFIVLMLIVTGCTTKGKVYTSNLNSVNELQDKELKKVRVDYNTGAAVVYEISLGRGTNKMSSPYTTFQEYLERALTEHLVLSNLYNENSSLSIKTTLLDNQLDTGLSDGVALLSANFKILENDQEKLNKTFQISHKWESSFMAAIAIPRTVDNYVIAMQKLIDSFLSDDEVLKVLKK